MLNYNESLLSTPAADLATWLDYDAYVGGAPHTVTGTIRVLPQLWSPHLHNRRDILVYLPPSYGTGRRFPVLYMHDGQNLFDDATSFVGEWHVDETITALSSEGIEAIVVGLPNLDNQRMPEYTPFRNARIGGGNGERYLQFITETVKPLVDRAFHTLPDCAHTGILGSSLGGLISLYAFFAYPEVFGLVGGLSPALWFNRDTLFSFVDRAAFVPGKIYLDVGTDEMGGRFSVDVRRMRDHVIAKGYIQSRDLLYVEEIGGGHNEAAWGRRLPNALRFLLGDTLLNV